jgi:hypothetical protein
MACPCSHHTTATVSTRGATHEMPATPELYRAALLPGPSLTLSDCDQLDTLLKAATFPLPVLAHPLHLGH